MDWLRWLWLGFLVVGGLAIVGYHQIPDKGTRDLTDVLMMPVPHPSAGS